jgi:AbrB family looped-hinge helix DNA binding protein
MTTATIGTRFQVVIPKSERNKLNLKPHSEVSVEAKGDCIILRPLSGLKLRGIGKELADGSDASDYVQKLRSEWSRA